RHTQWNNGVVRVEDTDGTGYTRAADPAGGFTEWHWGPHKQDNYVLTRSPDGRDSITRPEVDDRRYWLTEKTIQILSHGSFGNQHQRDMLVHLFHLQAEIPGAHGTIELVDKLNHALTNMGSSLLVRLGASPIPGGRRVELADRNGRVSDYIDFF